MHLANRIRPIVFAMSLATLLPHSDSHAQGASLIKENIRDKSAVFLHEHITKEWTLRNDSQSTWGPDHTWRFVEAIETDNCDQSDDQGRTNSTSMATRTSFPLAFSVPHGNEYTFRVNMIVRDLGSKDCVKEIWELVDEFDQQVAHAWIKVKVVNAPISNDFEYPVPFGVEQHRDSQNRVESLYRVRYDFLDPDYEADCTGLHESEDWNALDFADRGDPIFAIGHGVVVAKEVTYNNNGSVNNRILLIRHVRVLDNGQHEAIYSRYQHLNSFKPGLSVGSVVIRGEEIGTIGEGGTAPHLDFGILNQAMFTVERWKEYLQLRGKPAATWEAISEPPSEAEAAKSWLCYKSYNPTDPCACITEQGRTWVEATHYNPHDAAVNWKAAPDKTGDPDYGTQFNGAHADIMIDNGGPGFSRTGANWEEYPAVGVSDLYRHYYRFPEATEEPPPEGTEEPSATWQPNLLETQQFDIFVGFWSTSESKVAKYVIRHADGSTDPISITQERHPLRSTDSAWYQHHLGIYTFDAGDEGYVEIKGSPGAAVDQVIFKPRRFYRPAAITSIDTVLIIDSSGSMSWNDPTANRLEAARFLVDRSEDGDYIAVVDFDSYARSWAHLQEVRGNRDALKAAINRVNSSGGTNIGAGLAVGYAELSSNPTDNEKIAILLTDGQGSYSNQVDPYISAGWRVFTIGLGAGVDRNLLENRIAIPSGGRYFPVATEEAAQNAILTIYQEINRVVHRSGETIHQESLVVPQGGIVDRLVDILPEAISVWFDRIIDGSDVEMLLIRPDGSIIDRDTELPEVYHALGATYEIYRIDNPMPGEWLVRLVGTDTPPSGENTKLTVAVTIPDTDGDGLRDHEDNCPAIANSGQSDVDGDTVGDVCDNCVNVPNPAQADSNGDGIGDACGNAPPVAICQDVVVESVGGTCDASASVDAGSYDPDSDAITLDQSPAEPYGLGSTPITLSVTDDQGASSSCSATVTVEDTTAPFVTAPSDISIQHTAPLPNGVSLGSPTVSEACDGSPSVTNNAPAAFPLGTTTVTWTVTDASGNSSTVAQQITLLNTPPVANEQSVTVAEDSVTNAIMLTGFDVNGDSLSFSVTSGPSHGALGGTPPSITYTPDANYFGSDGFSFVATDGHGETGTAATVSITVTPVNDTPVITVDRSTATVQYSDTIGTVTVTATDVDDHPLTFTSKYQDNGSAEIAGLPVALSTTGSCSIQYNSTTSPGTSCSWTMSGQMLEDAGDYDIGFTVTDNSGATANTETEIIVEPERATVAFGDDNPVSVLVASDGGNSGIFSLTVLASEIEPDVAFASGLPGDIGKAVISTTLQPVGPGGSVLGSCTPDGVNGTSGYDTELQATCVFDDVPVNTYTVQVAVDGGYYTGSGEDVLVVYDPSLGFTTGGGWFYWPGTTDKTNFGYNMKYGKNLSRVQGNLLLIRHLPDETIYRVKSNALDGLALGESDGFGWASFSGKNTYQEPGWPDPIGNHTFVVYGEDHAESGAGADRFWIEVKDKDGNRTSLSIPLDAVDNAETLGGGNIVVPHTR